MRFSIITITKDNLGGLKDTQESITVQTVTDYEWIIIDGASNDGTKEFLENIPAQWVSEADKGLYDAMNKGIERARGDYIIFLNAGDIFADKNTLQHITKSDADFIYGDALEETHYKKARSHKKIIYGLFTHHQSMIYKRALIEDLRYDLNYRISADYKFTVQFLQKCETIEYIPKPLCVFETGGVSQQNAGRGRTEQFHIRAECLNIAKWQNISIRTRQKLAWIIRQYCPRIYWLLKTGR